MYSVVFDYPIVSVIPVLQFVVSEPTTPRLAVWADYHGIESPVDWRWHLITKRRELESATLGQLVDAALTDDPLTYTAALQVLRGLDMDSYSLSRLEWQRDDVSEFARVVRSELRKNPTDEQKRRLNRRALAVYDLLDAPFQR